MWQSHNFQHIPGHVFGTVLLRLGLLFRWIGTSRRADVNPPNSDCAALRAMTFPKRENAAMLFITFA